MTEARFSFTTKVGADLFTVRGDTFDEFMGHLILAGAVPTIGNLIGALNGEVVPAIEQHVVAQVSNAFGATEDDPFGGSFAPIAPPSYQPVAAPVATAVGDRTCAHGTMVKRTGVGARGEWRAWFCPTPKDTPGQCKPAFADKRNPNEWNAF